MEQQADLLFGKLAVQKRFLTEILVDEALDLQKQLEKKGVRRTVGDILLEKGYLTAQQVAEILKIQAQSDLRRKDIIYGKIAVRNKLATAAQVKECLAEQASRPSERLGEILMSKKYLSFYDHCNILKAQSRLLAQLGEAEEKKRIEDAKPKYRSGADVKIRWSE